MDESLAFEVSSKCRLPSLSKAFPVRLLALPNMLFFAARVTFAKALASNLPGSTSGMTLWYVQGRTGEDPFHPHKFREDGRCISFSICHSVKLTHLFGKSQNGISFRKRIGSTQGF